MSINLEKTIHITPVPDGYSQEEIDEKLSEKLDVAPDGVNDLIGSDDKINPIYLSGGDSSDATSIYYDGNLVEDVALDGDTLIITNSQVGSVSSSNPDLIVEYTGAEGIQSDTYEFVATASTAQYSLDLSSNGTMGGSTKAAACSTNEGGHDAYMAFDNSSSTTWGPSNANPNEWVTLYDPAGIQIKTVSWLNGSYSEIFPITLIQGSNDNSEFTTIYTYNLGQDPVTDLEVNADTAYKYIRFYFPQPGNYGKFTLTSMVVDNISWSLGGNTVDLADYGITCSGEVSTGDTITLVLEDGNILSANIDVTQIENDIENLKIQTNTLLVEKQDVLTPNSPLTIETKAVSNLNGFDYTQDVTGIYTSDSSSISTYCQTSYDVTYAPMVKARVRNGGVYATNDEEFYSCGYIDIPFELNKTYSFPGMDAVFGKKDGDNFIPLFIITEASINGTYRVTTSDTYSYSSGGDWTNLNTIGSKFDGSGYDNTTYSDGLYRASQFIENTANYSITINNMFPGNGDGYGRVNYYTATGDFYSRIKEATTCRLIPTDVTNAGNPIRPINLIGKWDYTDSLGGLSLSALGTNEFDITGVETYNFLDLNIGTGLAIQNNKLVNTNPPIVITNSMDYGDISPDSSTLYIITDTGAIYLGSTLIAQKNAS